MKKKSILIFSLGLLIVSTAFVQKSDSSRDINQPTCTGSITSVTYGHSTCVYPTQTLFIRVQWSGAIPALELTGIYGFEVLSSNPEDVCCGSHSFQIRVNNDFDDGIYFNVVGAGGNCYGVDFGAYYFPKC